MMDMDIAELQEQLAALALRVERLEKAQTPYIFPPPIVSLDPRIQPPYEVTHRFCDPEC